jgi:hypothetical protein
MASFADAGGQTVRSTLRQRDLQDTCRRVHRIEQFQEKWKPLFRPELRPTEEMERFIDSTER